MTIHPTVAVSDHALLRYLERVKGIDVEAARAEVVAITGVASALGAQSVGHNGHVYIIRGYKVTTVAPRGARFDKGGLPRTRYPKPGAAP